MHYLKTNILYPLRYLIFIILEVQFSYNIDFIGLIRMFNRSKSQRSQNLQLDFSIASFYIDFRKEWQISLTLLIRFLCYSSGSSLPHYVNTWQILQVGLSLCLITKIYQITKLILFFLPSCKNEELFSDLLS